MLQAPLHTKEITTAQISAVSFGFFSDEEIRKISVQQVTSPIIFDNLKNPIKGGLYDPSMGPMDAKQKCTTCGLNHYECPGHFGHVELAVPLYNPLVFITLYKLLRVTCLHCFKLRMNGNDVERFRRRLELLASGKLAQAENLVVGTSAAAKKSGGDMIDEAMEMEDLLREQGVDPGKTGYEYDVAAHIERSAKKSAKGLGPRSPSVMTAQTLESMIETIGDFFRRQPTGKCQNCGAHSPTIKREGHSKIFMMPLPAKKRAANLVQGTPILSVFARLMDPEQEVRDVEAEIAAQVEKDAASRKRRRTQNQDSGSDKEEEDEAEDNKEKEEDSSDTDVDDDDDEKEDLKIDDVDMKDVPAELDSFKLSDKGSEPPAPKRNRRSGASISAAAAADDAEASGSGGGLAAATPKFLTVTEVEEILKRMWELNEPIMALIYPTEVVRRQRRRLKGAFDGAKSVAQQVKGYQDFFLHSVPVAPNRFRPVNRVGDMVYEHPQNTLLAKVLNGNLDLLAASGAAKGAIIPGIDLESMDAAAQGQAQLGRSLRVWLELQNSLNALFDSSAADETHGVNGIRQQLEKKEGLFRKNMMGKRVNFAARSVISPDVYLNGGEIGVPPYFASRLSFPERVTPWNVERLREAVIAGPGRNPGATAVEDEKGRILLLRKDKKSREAIAKTLYTNTNNTPSTTVTSPGIAVQPPTSGGTPYGGGKVVYRTMTDGDFMLTNRQPTLHKPGMMGHKARIMRAERTIRFHYANCSTFNADFDGDEINLHLPQDHLGRAEGYGIVHADEQFFVPTDGKPLRGLIQDHIVAGTLLTMKDTFLTQAEYCQLVYDCVAPDCSGSWEVWMEPPTIFKPQKLWTGKQAFTAVMMHYTRDQLPCTLSTDSKIPLDIWGKTSGEGKMQIWRNHLVAGCIDKATFGKHGLLHIFHELYGAERTSVLTAAFSRLFTGYLQKRGFTCGMSDVFLQRHAEDVRADLLATADTRALEAAALFVGLDGPQEAANQGKDVDKVFPTIEKSVRAALSERFRSNKDTGVALDMKASGAMHPLSSEVVKVCLPNGQARPFRHNMMALMTVTGAKGSVVNFSQISCLLGQQELEGRRVPRMASGKTLPCFSAYDPCARSGGFIGDRFLTGLRPQEYYFHCMAGREGLVDTTVKTSRSGYLQRCLIKNLESLRVGYDCTVRDDCDGSIVQFLYGEDGVDPMATGCLRTLPLLYYNSPQLAAQLEAAKALDQPRVEGQAELEEKACEQVKARAKALVKGKSSAALKTEVPLNAEILQTTVGVTSEGFQDALTNALFGGMMLPPDPEGVSAAYKALEKKVKKAGKKGRTTFDYLDPMDFQRLMHVKYYRSQAQPGEAVGVIAAQSVGEPSTQMTLNTFHMAGRGEANVTLGIPRLREILMTAAATIKTPVMTLPLQDHLEVSDAQTLAVRLKRIKLAEALKALKVDENVVAPSAVSGFGRARVYTVRLQFHSPDAYPKDLNVTFEEISTCFINAFVPKLQQAVKVELKKAAGSVVKGALAMAKVRQGEEGGAVLTSEAAAPSRKKKSEKDDEDENEEENEEYREGKLRFTGGHGEQATYDKNDEEDVAIERASRKEAAKRTGEEVFADGAASEHDSDDDEDDQAAAATQKQSSSGAGGKPKAAAIDASTDIDEDSFACEAVVTVPLDAPKVLMREIAERVAASTIMRGVPGIAKCYVLDAQNRGSQVVQTDGINIYGAWDSADLLDVDRLTTNNPASMLAVYGVEAARATVVKEVTSVFGAYGIGVDARHLSLIADHMTHVGGYRACNRIGIESSTSPFLKISFETAASFLVAATLHGEVDPLTSPAARIVLGRPVGVGTGSMELVQNLKAVPKAAVSPI